MTTAERAALMERLRAAPDRVATLATGARATRAATARAARAAAAGGSHSARRSEGWSEREILAHLVRVEREVFQARLRQLASETEPHWSWVEPGAEPGRASLARLVARFRAARGATIAHLATLDEPGWARHGVHATYGRLDVAGLIGIVVDHDAEHVAELERHVA